MKKRATALKNRATALIPLMMIVIIVGAGMMLLVSAEDTAETVSPIVINPNADPIVIPDDTDGVTLWGENTTLAVNVTDDSAISKVTIDLSDIGGSPIANMSNIGNHSDGALWCMINHITNASAGTYNWNGAIYEPYCLQVNATDISDNFNISVCINVTVMKNGDVCPYDGDGEVDFTHDGLYLVRHTLNVPGYEAIRDNIADVTGDGEVDFTHDGLYLVRHTLNVPGYEVLH